MFSEFHDRDFVLKEMDLCSAKHIEEIDWLNSCENWISQVLTTREKGKVSQFRCATADFDDSRASHAPKVVF